jgi:hypothetical protein
VCCSMRTGLHASPAVWDVKVDELLAVGREITLLVEVQRADILDGLWTSQARESEKTDQAPRCLVQHKRPLREALSITRRGGLCLCLRTADDVSDVLHDALGCEDRLRGTLDNKHKQQESQRQRRRSIQRRWPVKENQSRAGVPCVCRTGCLCTYRRARRCV